MRYLLFIVVLALFFVSGKQETRVKTIGLQTAHKCWENNLGCLQLNEDDSNFELPDNNDFDGPLADLVDQGNNDDEHSFTGVHIYPSSVAFIQRTVPYTLIDLPPPTFS